VIAMVGCTWGGGRLRLWWWWGSSSCALAGHRPPFGRLFWKEGIGVK
jgi:hypothetical protein